MALRAKTLRTTLQKLHRQPDLRSLAQIRDLARLRVVVYAPGSTLVRALDGIAAMIGGVEAGVISTDPAIRRLATLAQERVVRALDTANHFLEELA